MNSNVNDILRFFYSFIQSPKRIGSIVPSSHFLAKEMFRSIDFKRIASIVELGAGTGVFTKTIAEKLPVDSNGFIFEQNDHMRHILEKKHTNLQFFSNALDMVTVLDKGDTPQVDVVISSLPFANFSNELRVQIANAIYQALKPNGILVAFQYSWQMKQLFESLFHDVSISFVPFNIPPAFVYTCNKIDQ